MRTRARKAVRFMVRSRQSLSWRPVSERKTSSRSARPDEIAVHRVAVRGEPREQRRRGAAQVGDAGVQARAVLARPGDAGLARRARRGRPCRRPRARASSTARQALDTGLQRVAGDDLAVVDDDDAVAQPLGLFHVVRRVEQRLAAAAQLLEVVEDGVAALRIDADGRLVEDQDVGVVDQRGGDVEAPLHAAAEGRRLVLGAIGQADQLQRRVDALAQQRAGEAVERAEQLQVGGGAEVLVDRELLRHDADAALGARAVLGQLAGAHAPLADEDPAAVGGDQAAEHRHRRRLAGAVRPEQADDLAGADA